MCMQGFDSPGVIAVIIILSPFLLVGYGVSAAVKGVKHAVARKGPIRRRDKVKAKINHLKEKLIPDEVEQQLQQLKKLEEENQGKEEGAFFGLQLAVTNYYLRQNDEAALEKLHQVIDFLASLKKNNSITQKGQKILLFAYYSAATIETDRFNHDEALKYFDEAVQQWTIIDSIPSDQTERTLHFFEKRDFHKPRTCDVCQKVLFGKSRHGLECKVCASVVHPGCVVDVVTPCGYNPNNNQSSGIDALLSARVTLPSLLNSRGLAFYYTGHYDKALKDFDCAIQSTQSDKNESEDQKATLGMYLANRGLVHFYTKNFEATIADTTSALGNGFVSARVYTVRASAYQLLGRMKEAIADRKEARKHDGSVPLDVFPYELPIDLIITVFSFLERPSDLSHAAQTCNLWKQIIYDHTNLTLKQPYLDQPSVSYY